MNKKLVSFIPTSLARSLQGFYLFEMPRQALSAICQSAFQIVCMDYLKSKIIAKDLPGHVESTEVFRTKACLHRGKLKASVNNLP